jgi:hypothetical protein
MQSECKRKQTNKPIKKKEMGQQMLLNDLIEMIEWRTT